MDKHSHFALFVSEDKTLIEKVEEYCHSEKLKIVSYHNNDDLIKNIYKEDLKILFLDDKFPHYKKIFHFLYNLSLEYRNNFLCVLMSDNFNSGDLVQAFNHSVDVVIHKSKMSEMKKYLAIK